MTNWEMAITGMDESIAVIRDCCGNAAAAANGNAEVLHQLQIISDLCALHCKLRDTMEDL